MKDSKHTCEHCGAELTVSAVVTYNHDDGGSIDSIDIEYVPDECYECTIKEVDTSTSERYCELYDEDELPF
jgi:hypothetical protein